MRGNLRRLKYRIIETDQIPEMRAGRDIEKNSIEYRNKIGNQL